MSEHLFVYGTLHPSRAPREIAGVARKLTHVGHGTIRGRLYDLGDYPGVILDDDATEPVHGEVFALPPDPDALACLDAYEDYRPHDPEGSLFLRQKTTVTLADGSRETCWVYVYNRQQGAP
ncbi:MAG TPA: gamma-glutamylcyclotransferase family protein [Acidobacteriaceae bacterium]